ncbi:MAG TPA: hypothetical protein P5205_19080 [Candidatus Paceibacterota bacterium]|nr:hypothetical protein [Verrucomicrobiota bacterium]HSA12468.1 hypothetical protein [Candidatus Paceibacterota bacterium]
MIGILADELLHIAESGWQLSVGASPAHEAKSCLKQGFDHFPLLELG